MEISEKSKSDTTVTPEVVPLLPLRDLVVFPHMVVPLFVGREKSVSALDASMSGQRLILLAAQKDATTDNPEPDEIYSVGTLAEILQLLKLPDGTIKVLVEGIRRVNITDYLPNPDFFEVTVDNYDSTVEPTTELTALMRSCITQFEQYVKMNKRIPPETVLSISNQEDPDRVADTIAAQMILKVKDKQEILDTQSCKARIDLLLQKLTGEIEILRIEKKIRGNVRGQMEQTQREYYLNEQMKAIQKELGKRDDDFAELEELREKIEAADMPEEAKTKADRELRRLEKMSGMSAESTVARTYLDWLVELPWNKSTEDSIDLKKAIKILNQDHFGLEKPKERILEYLAVRKLADEHKGPILCFVGPPGVGKTSLGRSIARSMGREFVRISLGGVRDEAEIRGHRRTYVGALPGRIIQGLRRAGTNNPVFLLDEIDKMGNDFRGDPSAALLEVLDPEQNQTYADHYLDLDFDLSQVMFITTANILHPIPKPLLDRMEVISLSGYTDEEKVKIASIFLMPKQLKEHGLEPKKVRITDEAILRMLREYTREAGVRNLERTIAKTCRKIARQIVEKKKKKAANITITRANLPKLIGKPKYRFGKIEEKSEQGVAMGLAWTEAGGELLSVEVLTMPGTGKVAITGQLGDVMQESAQGALAYVRSRADIIDLKTDFYKKNDIHIHVPEGAIPKDGPSAGITMAIAMLSAFSGVPVRRDVAMTGEITLRGKVLPIGGLKEKSLAANRGSIHTIICPKDNERDLEDIPPQIRKGMKFHCVATLDEVIKVALPKLSPGKKTGQSKKTEKKKK